VKPVANQNYHYLTIPYDAKVSWGAGDVAVSHIDVELWDPVNNVKLGMVTNQGQFDQGNRWRRDWGSVRMTFLPAPDTPVDVKFIAVDFFNNVLSTRKVRITMRPFNP
jgi:hypothetical protein